MESQYQSQSMSSETESEFQLPDAVLDFIHWAQDPSPPLFTLPEYQYDRFQQFRSNAQAVSVIEPDSDKESTSQLDTGSITEPDYNDPHGVIPAMTNLLIIAEHCAIQVYNLLAIPTMTTRQILAEGSDAEFCIKTFLLLFGII